MKKAIELLQTMMLRRPCTHLKKVENLWQFRFGNEEASLNIECPWRLLRDGAVAFGDEDDGQQFGLSAPIDGVKETAELLSISPVSLIEIREGCGDLYLTFENGVRLEAFNGSSGYEGWTCSGPLGPTVVAQGGGNISIWNPTN